MKRYPVIFLLIAASSSFSCQPAQIESDAKSILGLDSGGSSAISIFRRMNDWYSKYKFGIGVDASDASTNADAFKHKAPAAYQKEMLAYLVDQRNRLAVVLAKLDGNLPDSDADVTDTTLLQSSQDEAALKTFSVEQILRLEAAEVADLAKVIISDKPLGTSDLATRDRLVLFLNNSRQISDYLDVFATQTVLDTLITENPDLRVHYDAADKQWPAYAAELVQNYRNNPKAFRDRVQNLIGNVDGMIASLNGRAPSSVSASALALGDSSLVTGLLAVFAAFAQGQPARDQSLQEPSSVFIPPSTAGTGSGSGASGGAAGGPTLADDGIQEGMDIGLSLADTPSAFEGPFLKKVLVSTNYDQGLSLSASAPLANFRAPDKKYFQGMTTGKQKLACVRYACYPGVLPIARSAAPAATKKVEGVGFGLSSGTNTMIILDKVAPGDIFTQGSLPTCATQSAYSVAYISAKERGTPPKKILPTNGDEVSAKVNNAIVMTQDAMNTALIDLESGGIKATVADVNSDFNSIKQKIDAGIAVQAAFSIDYQNWTNGGTNGGQEFLTDAGSGFNLSSSLSTVVCADGGAGHAVAIVGYTGSNFIIKNSWGLSWGKKGLAILDWASCGPTIGAYGPPHYFKFN